MTYCFILNDRDPAVVCSPSAVFFFFIQTITSVHCVSCSLAGTGCLCFMCCPVVWGLRPLCHHKPSLRMKVSIADSGVWRKALLHKVPRLLRTEICCFDLGGSVFPLGSVLLNVVRHTNRKHMQIYSRFIMNFSCLFLLLFLQLTPRPTGSTLAPPGRSDARTPNTRLWSWRRSSCSTCTSRGTGGMRWRGHSTWRSGRWRSGSRTGGWRWRNRARSSPRTSGAASRHIPDHRLWIKMGNTTAPQKWTQKNLDHP